MVHIIDTSYFTGFEDKILKWMSTISAHTEQNSGMLSELLNLNRSSRDPLVTPPNDLPNFPIRSLEEFRNFDLRITAETSLKDYLVILI